ncbi:MAG: nodulation protein NfeD [Deltaproteobacteria bacterium]|nr:MAG: nodulation protein NfeD [Deltaproteobacteria bacterium]
MAPKRGLIALVFLLVAILLPGLTAQGKAPFERDVYVITISSSINPAVSDFIITTIQRAEEENAGALVIQLDTPGGLDRSMRDIIKAILSARVPVIVYVAPPGARAASAGVLITLASDIAAMAPGTNIGAAHPVAVGGGKMDETMAEKIANDAAAYARSIAEKRGRNAEWAEEAVRKSVSLTEKEALEKNVIDLIAADLSDLLDKVHGLKVEKDGAVYVLETRGAAVRFVKMGLRHRILNALSDPNVAYILLMIGIYGIFFELSNPGAIFPGVVGGICLILGFYALQTLSVNYAGFLLILLALVLFILEIKVQSYGMLTLGGIISLFLGSVMLFKARDPYLRISLKTIIPMIVLSALFFGAVIFLAVRAQRQKPKTGFEGIIGQVGIAQTDIDGRGKVFVSGEIWDAFSERPVRKGQEVVVTGKEGFRLKIKPLDEGEET